MWSNLLMVLLFLTAVVLILLILVQRGKGGGLAGAFGGMGGQSAFGTKAGDTFTKITIGVAIAWLLLCVISVGTLQKPESKLNLQSEGAASGETGLGAGAGEDTSPAPTDGSDQ